ncbi:NAD-dependent dehydratase [Candidatus Woesebacteria bacterium RBG_16_36_11]|uniref:NAD-dependent dehydratase n=3 Tax=Candidatus Woeseibacteriota TaxID=1752722 RepID=A0A1F7X9A0_9BACT|nr:MAG: NAD-dependent dehydratase [Candidatus Woesebacteria bacterium RBG_13_36_22]OGM10895.1 MAG: NAD-dependent dehydratase [Candidatus Woesebacteria bacterium RBG_16_36_11]OGM16865.1 MAG: NAD-dependent dehydratase [Candidatus Woesebacteria bacterium RBG_19FT_COMBO_37_29]
MKNQKKALICGAGGFIGNHLVKRLRKEGFWVRGVDIKKPEYIKSAANEFLLLDLTLQNNCKKALSVDGGFDVVYQLAADRGGAGYMKPGECRMMRDNALINIYMISEAVKLEKKPKYFFSSSVCVYKDMKIGSKAIKEDDVYPAFPDNEYAWEKLYTERMLTAYGNKYQMPIRIARFHTTYGPEANWEGGREKAADAISRKVALAKDKTFIEIWGNGKAVRSFTYIDDLIEGIRALVKSDIATPTNIGSPQYVTVNELAKTIIKVSGKNLKIKHIKGPVGVESRNFSNKKIYTTGWKAKYSLEEGIKIHYPWVASQVELKYGHK